MLPYKALLQSVQRRTDLSFDEVLTSVAHVLRRLSHQLDAAEARLLKEGLASELQQLVTEGGPRGAHDFREAISEISDAFEISEFESCNRILVIFDELRRGVSPWDDPRVLELIDRITGSCGAMQAWTGWHAA